MQKVVKNDIIKWLDVRVIYHIEVQCVAKKGGIIVVPNESNELVPMRPVTRWRICMDY